MSGGNTPVSLLSFCNPLIVTKLIRNGTDVISQTMFPLATINDPATHKNYFVISEVKIQNISRTIIHLISILLQLVFYKDRS